MFRYGLTLIALSCITILLLMIYQKNFYKNQVKPNVNLIIYLYILLAIVMGVFLTTSTHQVIKNSHDFQSKIPSLKGWKNTKDVYQPNVQDNGAVYNKKIEIAQDKRFDRLLKSKENPGFLIDTENFTSEDGELPLYKRKITV